METFIFILIITFIIGSFSFNLWLSILNYKHRTSPIPDVVSDIYNKEEYQKWLDYSMENYRFGLVSSVVNLIIMLVFLFVGVFPYINSISTSLSSNLYIQILIFLGIYYFISFFINIFFSYYSNFSIEERYGFNKTTKKTFFIDKVKSLVLTIIFGGGLIYLLSTLYYEVGNMFYLYAWVSIVSILVFVNLFYVKLIVPIFNKLKPLEYPELKESIEQFAKKVGYEVNKISVIDASKRSTKLNAYFAGFGKLKQVVLYDTLVEKMSVDEIVAVLAHEIGHSKHKHIISGMFQSIIVFSIYLGVLLFTLNSPEISMAFGFTNANFGFGIIIFSVLLSPISILIEAISSGISRKHEYQADEFASKNWSKIHIENALKVLTKENFSNLTPHPLYVKLTYSHPPVADRINMIRKNGE